VDGQVTGGVRFGSAAGRWVIGATVLGSGMASIDATVVGIALPTIGRQFHAPLGTLQWVVTGYTLSLAALLLLGGSLGDHFGRRRVFVVGVVWFTVASAACAAAPGPTVLIVTRVLQGVGAALLTPGSLAILQASFVGEDRGRAIGSWSGLGGVATAAGPLLGGYLITAASWRWIFLINVPVCLLSLLLSHLILSDPPAVQKDREDALRGGLKVDFLGFILVAIGLACLQVVLDKGTEDDWFASDFILTFAVISAVALIALVFWELNHDDPIVDLPLMKNRNFSAAMAVMFVTGFILISTTQILPQYLQSIMGYTALKAGLALTVGGVGTLCMMPVVGALLQKVQPKYLIAFGLVVESLACYHLRGFNTDINFGHAAIGRLFQGVGLPFLFVPITSVSYVGLPPGKSNNASALINTMRNLGGSFGISLAVGVLANRGQYHHARLASEVTVFSRLHLATAQAVASFGQVVERQAEMLSYIDVFIFLAILAAACMPFAFLLQNVKPGGGEGAAP